MIDSIPIPAADDVIFGTTFTTIGTLDFHMAVVLIFD